MVADIRAQKFNAEAEHSADFVEFLGLAGLGQAEASGLTWKHINWKNKQIALKRHKTGAVFHIPIYPQLLPLMTKLRGDGKKNHDWPVFTGKEKEADGTPKPFKDAKHAIDKACKRLGYPPYSQRSFRRMFITRCIEKGIDVKVIAQWQGHGDGGKLILATYSHVRNVHAQEMAKLLEP